MFSSLNNICDFLYHFMVLMLMKEVYKSIVSTDVQSYSVIPDICPEVSQVFFNDRCFWKLNTNTTFLDAHDKCQQHGGMLTEVPDQDTDEMLLRYFGSEYWIGVNDIHNESQFVDMMNRSIEYKNWRTWQPNNRHHSSGFTDANCVRKRQNGWVDDPCTFRYKAICSKKISVNCSTDAKENPASDTCHWITVEKTTFYKADDLCQANNGMIAEIKDNSTLDLMYGLVEDGQQVWIGVHDLVLEGFFMNIRNETQCFGREKWKTLDANNDTSDCLAFTRKTARIAMIACNTKLPVVCSSSLEATSSSCNSSFLSKNRPMQSTSSALSTFISSTSVSSSTTDPVPSTTTKSSSTEISTLARVSSSLSTSKPTPSTTAKSSSTGSSTSVPSSLSTSKPTPSTTAKSSSTGSSKSLPSSLSTSKPTPSTSAKLSKTDSSTSVHISSTMSETTTVVSTTASSVKKGCSCPCERMKNQVIITDKKVLKGKIAKMKKELKVNKRKLNQRLRKRISVHDKRTSAVAMGTIFGPLFIALVVGILVISDIPILIRHLKYGPNRKTGKKNKRKRMNSDGGPEGVGKHRAEIHQHDMIESPA